MDSPQILALGGFPGDAMVGRILELARGPRVLWVGTASNEQPVNTVLIEDLLRGRAELSRVEFYPWPPEELRALALAQDVIMVGGGNTANMLAIWRVHGFDAILRAAWQDGVLLTGWSAGMICWYEAGVTDSFGPQLAGMRDGLGLLPGSGCPHYDGEERRRPVYTRLAADGFPPGLALDDRAGAYYVGTELRELLATEPEATGYRVTATGEERLVATVL
ncbi:MAG: Type 1 glutamine amidotransferase-like domain-containing protein [Gaiellaceae bacterium]